MTMRLSEYIRRLFHLGKTEEDSSSEDENPSLQTETSEDAEKQAETEEPLKETTIADTPFPSPHLNEMLMALSKYEPSQARQSNEGTEWKVLSTSCVDALKLYFRLEEIDIASLEQKGTVFGGITLRMTCSNDRYVEFSTMTENAEDTACITYMEKERRVMLIRFVRQL